MYKNAGKIRNNNPHIRKGCKEGWQKVQKETAKVKEEIKLNDLNMCFRCRSAYKKDTGTDMLCPKCLGRPSLESRVDVLENYLDPNGPMINYAHKKDPKGNRFKQYAKDPLPKWAVDVKSETSGISLKDMQSVEFQEDFKTMMRKWAEKQVDSHPGSILIGNYILYENPKKGKINILIKDDGEGGEFNEEELVKVIDKFYKKHF